MIFWVLTLDIELFIDTVFALEHSEILHEGHSSRARMGTTLHFQSKNIFGVIVLLYCFEHTKC